ncbi:MAG: Lrp/AsnC family transcriptional regulator [Nocardioidaceae bacterium]
MALDQVDLALLDELKQDGRAPFETLGSRVGLSRTAARARVQKILDSGVVTIEAIVHPVVDGLATFAHVSIVTDGRAARSVADEIASLDNAPFVSVVAGRFSVIAEQRTSDLGQMEERVAQVRDIAGVASIDTVLYTDVVKDSHLPLGGPHAFRQFDLDDVDRRLLTLLQTEPRMPYADLADHVGLSRGATRARVLRMLKDGVVVVTGMTNATAFGITQMCGFQVNLDREGSAAVEKIASLRDVDFLARTLGRCDVIGTIIARNRVDMHQVLDEIRAYDGVRDMEAWSHLELVKERYSPQSEPSRRTG